VTRERKSGLFAGSFLRIREPVPPLRRLTFALLGVALCVVGYQRIGRDVDEKYSPSALQVAKAAKGLYETEKQVIDEAHPDAPPRTQSLLLADVRSSLERMGWGFGLGLLAALIAGSLMAAFKDTEAVIGPPITFLSAIPPIAFMAYFMIVLGGGFEFQVGIIAYAVFLDLVGKVKNALEQVQKQSVDALFTLGASRFEVWLHMIRQSLPEIVRGAHLSLNLAWVYLIAAESVGAETGLGIRILKLKRYTKIDDMFAIIMVIGIIALTLDLVFRYGNLIAFPWDEVNRRELVRMRQKAWYKLFARRLGST
jgi:ABC-type nitrate/sulfonate/bicarbonate transport system permease component